MLRLTLTAATAAVSLAAAAPAQDVLVVDPVGGDFATIQAAVDAAAPGDIVVLDALLFAFDLVVDKGITLVATAPGIAFFEQGLHVRDVPAGQTVVISGITGNGATNSADPSQGYGLEITNCAGDVRVQDCVFTGADGDPDGWEADLSALVFTVTGHVAGWPGIRAIDNTGSVTFTNVVSTGGDAASTFSYDDDYGDACGCTFGLGGGHGAAIIRTDAAFDACTLTGGRGGVGDSSGGRGGDGLRLIDQVAIAAGSTLTGGNGGFQADALIFGSGGSGGDGAWMAASPDLRVLGTTAAGGVGGGGWGSSGAAGVSFGGTGTLDVSPNTWRALDATALAADDASVELSLAGIPGDAALLFVSPSGASFVPSLAFDGAFSIGFPALSLPLGALPASGTLALTAPLPALAPLAGVTVHLQAVAGQGGDVTLTGHRTLTIAAASEL